MKEQIFKPMMVDKKKGLIPGCKVLPKGPMMTTPYEVENFLYMDIPQGSKLIESDRYGSHIYKRIDVDKFQLIAASGLYGEGFYASDMKIKTLEEMAEIVMKSIRRACDYPQPLAWYLE